MSKRTSANNKPYQARVEYRAVQPEVEELLAAGHSIRSVYDELIQDKRLTISYSSFCDYVRGRGTRQHGRPKKIVKSSSKMSLQPSPPPGKAKPFTYERNVPLEKLT